MPIALAIVRRLQWVASGGTSVNVFSSTRLTTCAMSGALAGRPRLVAAQAVHAGLDIARPPAPNGRQADPQSTLNLVGSNTVAGQQHDPGAPDMLLRRVAIGYQSIQPIPIPGRVLDPHFLAHIGRVASNPPVGNLLFRAEH